MRICALIPRDHIGGGTKVLLRYAQYLSLRHDVVACYPVVPYWTHMRLAGVGRVARARRALGDLRRNWRALAMHRPPLAFDDIKHRVRYEWYLAYPKRTTLERSDVILFGTPWSYHELARITLGGPKKVFLVFSDYMQTAFLQRLDLVMKAYTGSDARIAPSRYISDALRDAMVKSDAVIEAAIDDVFMRPSERPKDERPSILAYCFRDSYFKGAPTLIRALQKLRRAHPDVRLALVGPAASAMDRELPVICDTYYSGLTPSDLAEVYRRHAIFIYPGYTEGFQAPPLEAMASGCAVVATTVGAVPDYATHERNALLCAPMDPEALFREADRLLRDVALRERLSSNAARDARTWTWTRATEKLENFLVGLVPPN